MNKRLITIVLFVILIFVLPSVFPAAVTFNVYQSRGPTFTVSGINVDCNGTTYDRTSQTSPFTINFDSNVYSCVISNTNSNWESTTVDVNTATVHTETVYMDFENYPVVYQFLQSVDASTSANTLQTVASWTYTPSFGTDTNVQVGCSISILASAHAFTAEWAIQSSPDGSTWTTQGTVSRVLTTSMVGSVYVSTGTWSVADGTRYFRLMHRRTTTPTAAVITSKNAVCDLFTNKSDNNSTIKTSNIVVGDTTVSGATYGTLTTSTFATSAYNGFLVTLGAINYKQNNSNDSTIGFRIYYNSTTAVAEYPRFVVKNTNASGSFAEYTDVNANQNVNLVFQGKRSAATSTINIPGAFVYHLSQDPNEYAQVNLASKTVSSASYVPIASMILTEDTIRDIYVNTIAPVTCSIAGCQVDTFMEVKGTTYDVNSKIISRSFPTITTYGTLKNQYVFSDVNDEDANVILWGRASIGTATIQGGNFLGFTVNQSGTTLYHAPNAPQMLAPVSGSYKKGIIDYNCYSSDIDETTDLNYDVNLLKKSDSSYVATIMTKSNGRTGYGDGNFNSALYDDGNYTFACRVTDTGVGEGYIVNMSDPSYWFFIDNNAPVTTDNSDTSWHSTNQTITLTPTDSGGSGIKNTYYCITADENSSCTPSTIGTTVTVTCGAGSVCQKYVKYFSEDNTDNNETTKTSNLVKIDSSVPAVGATTTSSFSTSGSYIKGTGKVIGGTVTGDVNTSTCEYTINGSTWSTGSYVTNHCESGNITITNATTYIFNTRIANLAGTVGSGTPTITYTGDLTSPSVGVTTISGFTTYNNFISDYITGNGNVVGGTATDSGSGVDTTTCEYTLNNGSSWLAGNWSTDHCVSGTITISNGVVYQFNTRVKDKLANLGTGTATISYTGDVEKPVTTITGTNSSYVNSDVNVSLSCSDVGAGCYKIYYSLDSAAESEYSSPITISTDGIHTINYYSVDYVNNTEVTKSGFVYIDKTPPVTTDNSDFNVWHASNLNITLTATDNNSGVKNTKYCVTADENTTCTPTTIGTTVNVTCATGAVCLKYIKYFSTDNTDNTEETKTSNLIQIDRSYPTVGQTSISGFITSGIYFKGTGKVVGGYTTGSVGSDLNTSTCEYTIDGNTWQAATWLTDHCESSDFNVSDSVTYIFNTRITNNAGQIGTGTSVSYTGDYTPPVITGDTLFHDMTIYGSYFKGTGSITSGTVTDTGAGVDTTSCEYTRNAGEIWLEGTWDTDHCVRYGTIMNAVQYFSTFRIKDKLGNSQLAPYAIAYIGDTTSPTTTIYGNNTTWENTEKTIDFSCDDNGLSGCASTNYRINSGVWQTYSSGFTLADGSYQIDYYSVDNLANTEITKTNYLYQDRVAPVTADNSDTLWHSGVVNVILTPSDATSGVLHTYYCISDTNTCTPTTLGVDAAVTCDTNICRKYVRYYSTDNAGNTETIKTSNQVLIDSSYPTVDDTTTSGFTISTNYIKGTGKVIGGYVHDVNGSDINLSSCQYTIDGSNWFTATWITDHCESENVSILNATNYIFNTRIANNLGTIGYGTPTITYTGDLLSPSLGQTSFSGFTTFYNSDRNYTYINGTGKVVGATATDAGSGIDTTTCEYTINGTIWNPGYWVLDHCESGSFSILLDTNYIFNTRVKDNLGTQGTGTETIKYLEDITAPDAVLYGLNNIWNNTPVNLDLNCEGHKSGCKSTTYRVDNGSWVTTVALSTRITLSTDGNHVIDYYSTDNLETSGLVQTSYMAVDTTKPTTTDNSDNQWHSSNLNITLSPHDTSSGINHTYYCVTTDENSSCTPETIGTTANVTCPASSICQKYVKYYSIDNAGNSETTKTSNLVKIDRSYPIIGQTTTSGFSIFESYIKGTGKIVGGTIIDTNGSGINTSTCEYTTDGFSWYAGTYVTDHCESPNIIITDGTIYSFNTRIEDNLGRLGSGTSTIAYTGDLLSPIIFGEIEIYNLTTYDNYFKGTGSVASGTITDAGVGVDTTSCEFTNDGGVTWTNESSWETDHCVMYGTTVDGVSYTFAFRVKDKLDNNKTSLYSETYTGDLSSPITTISGTTTSWSNTDVNITLTCDDNLSGCQITYYRIDDGAWFNYQGVFMISNDGNHHIDYYSKDNIGNTESLKIGTIAIDQTAPVTTDNSDNSWHSGTVNVTLTPTDSASGIMNTYYCISDTNDCTPTTIGTVVPVTCETENICTKYVRYFSTDYADNNESIKTSNQVKIDSSYPIVDDTTTSGFTIYNNYITGTGKVIGGYVHDDNGSEVNTSTCEYTINGNIWLPATWVTDHCESGNITITNAATYIFNTRITNNVGLIGYGTPTITYTGDTQAPAVGTTTVTGFSIYNNFINHSGIVVSGTATDSGSGINTSTCLYSVNDGNTWQQGTWMSTHCESPTFSVSGDQKIFKTRVSDNLGNIGTGAGTQTYTVDEVVPSTTAIGLNSSWNNTDVNITLTCDDGNGSGCKNSYYKINNGDYTEYTHMITLSGDGNILFNYRSVDNVDNNEIANTSYIAIDKTPPITTDNSDTSWHGENLNITLTPYDATSGINHTYYCIDETDSCNPTTLGIIVNITCPASSICQKYVRYYSTDMADNNESTKTSNLVKIDRTYPIVGLTTTSGFSISGNYIKGAGKVIGGTIIDTNGAGLDTNSCEYTTDGFSWYPGTYVTNHCESGDITVTDGTIYSFNTRIEDTLGRLATGIATINYTGDTLSPTVGNTTISDFNIAGLFITGTGTISAYASDSGVGIDYCEYTTNGSDWFSATWNASSGQCSKSITIANEATYAFNLRIIDKLSNTRNALSTTIYTGDTASPVTSIINDSNSWRKGTQILYLTCDDGSGSGCGYSYYTLNDTGKTYQYYDSIVFSDDGNHELDYYSNDKVGNYETQKATYVAIDNVSPTTTDNSDNLWHATDRNITLTSHDELSGVKNTYYCVDTQNACTPNTIGTLVSVTCSQDASCFKYIRYFSEDNADNNETTKFAIVKIDKAVPEVGQTTITGFTISGSHIKGTGRVIGGFTQDEDMNTSACQYTIDGINWLTATWVTDHCESGDINISDDVTYIFNTRMTSESGLVGYGTATIDYTGDLSGPSIGQTSFSGFTTFYNPDFDHTYINGTGKIVGATVNDTGSGVDITTCEYTIDGNIWQPGIWNLNHCESTYFTIILGGVYQFNTRAKDNIGNLGTGNSTITYLEDVTAPDALLYGLNDSWNNNTVTLDLNCEGHKSGCKSTTYRVDYGSWVTTIALSTEIILSTDGNHVIDYYSTDNLDTSGSIQTSYMAVDKTAPTTTDNTDGQWHSTDQIITLTAFDSLSGVDTTYYCVDDDETCDPESDGNIYSDPFDIICDTNICEYYINYFSTDDAGNEEETKTSLPVRINRSYPTVEQTTLSEGLTTHSNYIAGTGKVIGGKATSELGINENTCEYTADGGISWYPASWVTDHCESSDFNIVDGTLYQFNTRVEDDLGDLASGISTINYLGDMSAPIVGQTLVSGFNIYNNYINGSGLILGGIATDSVSDINTESCVITTGAQKKSKNATAYWSGNHCEMEFTSVSGQNYTFNSSVEDNMGNRGYGTATIEYTADGDSPVTTATGINNTWNNINTTILLSCDDSNKSGCKETEYRLDSGDWEVYVNGILINTDLNHKIEYYSLDNVDNNEAINTAYFALDRTKPTISSVDNSDIWQNTDFNIIFNNIDFNISGKESATYILNEGSEEDLEIDENGNYYLTITEDGNNVIDYNFTDLAGNSLTGTVSALLDSISPDVNLTETTVSRTAIISADISEYVTCRIDTNSDNNSFDAASSNDEKFGTEITWTFDNLSDGNHQYLVYCKDRADNYTLQDINFEIIVSSHGGNRIIYIPSASNNETEGNTYSKPQNAETPEEGSYTLVFSNSKIGEDGIVVVRTTEIIITKKDGAIKKASAYYTISLYNPTTEIVENILLTEYIPKEIANNVSDIDFTTYPTRIVSEDPVVEWLILSINPGETIDLNYTIKKVVQTDALDNNFISNAKMTDMALIYDEDDINDILEDTVCVNGKCSKIRHNFSWIYWVIGIIIIIFFVFWIIERKTNPRNRFPRY